MISPSSRRRSEFAEHCRVREVAVELIGSWLSSYVPLEFELAAEFGGRCGACRLVAEFV